MDEKLIEVGASVWWDTPGMGSWHCIVAAHQYGGYWLDDVHGRRRFASADEVRRYTTTMPHREPR